MGGFTGLFDRPDPTTTSLVKNRNINRLNNGLLDQYGSVQSGASGALNDYIRKYLANTKAAEAQTGQESAVLDKFYNGDMANTLAGLRAKRASAINNAADVGVQQALRSVAGNSVAEQGGPSSYERRLAIGAATPIRVNAAVDQANQERSDLDYMTGNQINLAGGRTRMADALASRAFGPTQAGEAMVSGEAGSLSPLIGFDQANKFYGIQQKPGLLDRMQQETQFLQGLQSIMKNQYGTASEAYGGWAGGGMGGGGGGGGMGSMMGGMGMRRGGLVLNYTSGGGVRGPGTGTSDSIDAKLSNGEFVVPAAAVRLPGVLKLLNHLREVGLEHERAHIENGTHGTAHMASGGLLYADSFGQLGNQALSRDAFNESVVGGQAASIQQQSNIDRNAKQTQDQSAMNYNLSKQQQYQNFLRYYGMPGQSRGGSVGEYDTGSGGGVAGPMYGGYDADSRGFARGGYVHTMPVVSKPYVWHGDPRLPLPERVTAYGEARQGVSATANPRPSSYTTKHFAEGGMVGDELEMPETARWRKLAEARVAELQAGGQTPEQQRLGIDQSYLDLARRRQDLAEKTNTDEQTPAQIRDREFQERMLGQIGATGGIDSPEHAAKIAPGSSETARQLAYEASMSVRQPVEDQWTGANRAAALLNKYEDLTSRLPKDDQGNPIGQRPPTEDHWYKSQKAVDAARESAKVWDERAKINAAYVNRLKTSGLISQDNDSGQWVPAMSQPRWLQRATNATGSATSKTSTATNGAPAATKATNTGNAYKPSYPPEFYTRVNALVTSGMPVAQAKYRALEELNMLP